MAAPLLALYLVTASWTLPYHIDAVTNVFTAWELGTHGDVYLDHQAVLAAPEYLRTVAWVVPAGDSAASQYPPGAAAIAAPLYAIWPQQAKSIVVQNETADVPPVEILMPPIGPAAMTAAMVSAIAMGLLALVFCRLTDARTALIAAYVAGLGTGVWSVAADSLWQHGPAMLWIIAGVLLSTGFQLWSGLAFGAAVLTRPHTALVAAGNGLYQSWRERSVWPALKIGLGATLGLAALVWFNAVVFGSPSISGGYSGVFTERAASLDLAAWGRNLIGALVDPVRGLLVYSPFLILLLPGLPAAWRKAPDWVRGSALGGLAYILVQLKANRFSGGDTFWGYRYPLEMLAAAAPLLLLSYTEWVRRGSALLRRMFFYVAAVSILFTAVGAIVY
ncbi:MAG: hypothetical protein WBV06_06260 [Acidimicrobiia bacterium]